MGNAAAIVHYAEVTAPCQAASSPPSSKTERQPATSQSSSLYATCRHRFGRSHISSFPLTFGDNILSTSRPLPLPPVETLLLSVVAEARECLAVLLRELRC